MTKNKKIAFFGFLICVVLFKSFYLEKIHTKALYDFDEARYAEVAKNVVITNNYIVPLAGGPDEPRAVAYTTLKNGEKLYPYFWKPPLHTLIIALFFKLFGISELSVRLPSVLFSIGSMMLVYVLSKSLFKKYTFAPFLASALFISTNDFSVITSQGLAEAQLIFFSLLSILFALKKTPKHALLSGLFFGLAFMTKSFITFWIPLVVIYIFFTKNIRNYIQLVSFFIGMALVVILPWHLYMYVTFGDLFINRYVVANVLGRAGGGQNAAPLQWYFIYMLDQWKPYVFLLPAFSFFVVKDIVQKKRATLLLLFWILVVLIPLSIVKSKVFWYIFPIWIPIVILISYYFERAYKEKVYFAIFVSIVLSFFSLLPYWQLSLRHIPLKQFIFVSLLLSAFMYFVTNRIKKSVYIYPLVAVIVFLSIGTYFSTHETLKRTDWNHDLKILLSRNQHMTHLYVVANPYESALFYSNASNINFGIENQTQFLLINAGAYNKKDMQKFSIKDREGTFMLLKRQALKLQ